MAGIRVLGCVVAKKTMWFFSNMTRDVALGCTRVARNGDQTSAIICTLPNYIRLLSGFYSKRVM